MEGLNVRFEIVRKSATTDAIGGALYTGTVTNECVHGHISANQPNQVLMEQGQETPLIADAYIRPGTIVVRERDVLEITSPINHPHYGDNWRVMGVQNSPVHPARRDRFIKLRLKRIERTSTEANI